MQRRHFLYLLIAMLALPPLALTGKLAWREAIAQNLGSGPSSAGAGGSAAQAPSSVKETRHNLSSTNRPRAQTSNNAAATGELTVTASSTSEVCVFCHTPHGATTNPGTPLWNRNLSGAVYTPYSSSSLQATDIDVTAAALGAPSKMCLSCHDGTIALGNVANAPGSGGANFSSAITVTNASTGAPLGPAGSMPGGRGQTNADHGFTRRLGTDLRNDHPISFTFNATLATADGELRTPTTASTWTSTGTTTITRPQIGDRAVGTKPWFPLVGNKVQCTTCHDPHKQTQKFLNTNRMVRVAPDNSQTSYTDWSFNIDDDQICVACHTRLGKAWAVSAHSHSTVANETYRTGDAAMRDFPTGTKVWQAGCLNCHDPHTVAGSRRLLREGSGSAQGSVTPGLVGYSAAFRLGSGAGGDYDTTSAIENTCYQCHSSTAVITPTTLTANEGVPNIQAEFQRLYHMPITNNEQGQSGAGNTTEVHDVTDKDKMESQTKLGFYAPQNRHVECTDCHNPHRVVKADTFLGANLPGGDVTLRTHVPARGTVGEYGNIAGGALRGTWGVEPSYTATGQTTVTTTSIWKEENVTFSVKKGDPGGATTLPVGSAGTNAATYLTREYQLCFKCHSSYANGPLATDFPTLKTATGRGGTVTGTNSVARYTDVAKEFAVRATDPPSSGGDQGEMTNTGCCDPSSPAMPGGTNNHRSWHPVVFPTGRTVSERGTATNDNFRAPFNSASKIGLQTMHCSDCHGSENAWAVTTGADRTKVQGPHGSINPFLLKSDWNPQTATPSAPGFCGNCHQPATAGANSGFSGTPTEARHSFDDKNNGRCGFCHIALPHGWKNKAFLVNLTCVGPENGETTGFDGNGCKDMRSSANGTSATDSYTAGPYYVYAKLRLNSWARSGGWAAANCTGTGGMQTWCGSY
jgi:hypothetical protein